MRRIPIPALIAALAVATAVIVIRVVLPPVWAPPYVYPSEEFEAPGGTYTAFLYSAAAVSVASNATASFYAVSLPSLPYVALSKPLPPNAFVQLVYRDPVLNTTVDNLYLKTDGDGRAYYYISGSRHYGPCFVNYMGDVPAAVYNASGAYVVVPDVSSLTITAGGDGVRVYVGVYYYAECGYALRYEGATGYSHAVGHYGTSIVAGGEVVSAVVRPMIVAAVRPAGGARITIAAS